jgi:hypothetical protein
MTIMMIMIALAFAGILIMFTFTTEVEELNWPFATLLILLVGVSIVAGTEFNHTFTVKKPKTPTLRIECKYGKCDTTYVYTFK